MSKPRSQLHCFAVAELDAGVVDAENGIIEGVSVITSGVQAKGHNLEVDDTTLQQMLEAAGRSPKGQVPVKWNHKSGADAVNGYFTDFRIVGHKLKADWHLLKSHSQFDHALELAERMPQNVGFSASFMGLSELEDGTKVYNPDEKTKTHYTISAGKRVPVDSKTKIFARCDELISVDLVATPAANPDGMFSARPVDSGGEDMANPKTAGDPADKKDAATLLLERFEQFEKRFDARLTNLEELLEEDPEDEVEEEEEEEEEAGGEGGADLSGIRSTKDLLNYFEARLNQAAADKEKHEFATAYQELEERVGKLVGVNEQLLQENQLLAKAYKELSANTRKVVEFSATQEGAPKPVIKSTAPSKQTDFEVRVAELVKEGKSHAEAFIFATEEDGDRYTQHLQAKGAITQTL